LAERKANEVFSFDRGQNSQDLAKLVKKSDFVFHLAGVNRPKDGAEFRTGNVELTEALAKEIQITGRQIPLVFTSSAQANLGNEYGQSKRQAEEVLQRLQHDHGSAVYIYRLPGVFGKWCRPSYNSVVATFCHKVARNLPIEIHNSSASLSLVHVDAVIRSFLQILDSKELAPKKGNFVRVSPQYETTVGDVARILNKFRQSRESLISERTGEGLVRDLYGTFLSYLPAEQFVYKVPIYHDCRGDFAEVLKTKDSGQFSYFSIKPGGTRGSHYHHRKSEKFLPLTGKVQMRFRHLVTGETSAVVVEGGSGTIIESVPGWVHDITNISQKDATVMLWANEIYDPNDPDCIPCEV